ncbi:MAG: hypothetical protein K1X79_13720 [Oligoflexia bacterium]|nr:hypothetical protein [Oligoflexia bacterium]
MGTKACDKGTAGQPVCEGGFEAELLSVVGADLRTSALRHATTLRQQPEFERAHVIYHRIVDFEAEPGDGLAATLGPERVAAVRSAFENLAKAWVLHLDGLSPQQVSERLGVSAAKRWLGQGSVPYKLARHDPQHRESKFRDFRDPVASVKSDSLAYVLGAFLATITRSSSFGSLSFSHTEELPLRRLQATLRDSLGIEPSVRFSVKGRSVGYYEIVFNTRGAVEFLRAATKSGAQVPWEHIQTSQERRAFLKGFFDFVSANILSKYGRFQCVKEGNPELIRHLAVVFKREGILGRVKVEASPSFLIAQKEEFLRLRELDVVQTPSMRSELQAICDRPASTRSGTLEEYRTFISAGRRVEGFPNVTPAIMIAGVKALDPTFDVPYHIVRSWLQGEVPKVYDRLMAMFGVESQVFPRQSRGLIAQAILSRMAGDWPHPALVVRAFAEFAGDIDALSQLVGLSQAELSSVALGGRPLSREWYQKLLSGFGLTLTPDLARAMEFPSSDEIESWLCSNEEEMVYASYRGSIGVALHAAYAAGRSLRDEFRSRLDAIMNRSHAIERGA